MASGAVVTTGDKWRAEAAVGPRPVPAALEPWPARSKRLLSGAGASACPRSRVCRSGEAALQAHGLLRPNGKEEWKAGVTFMRLRFHVRNTDPRKADGCSQAPLNKTIVHSENRRGRLQRLHPNTNSGLLLRLSDFDTAKLCPLHRAFQPNMMLLSSSDFMLSILR